MLEKLEKVETRYEEVQLRLCDPEIVTDQAQYKKLMQEAKRLAPIVEKYRQFKAARDTFQEAKALLDAGGLDKEFHDMVFEELEQARAEMERTQEELKVLLLPRDPNDEKNVIVEIRGGAGGRRRLCLQAPSCACIPCTPRQRAGRPKSSAQTKPSLAASKRLAL